MTRFSEAKNTMEAHKKGFQNGKSLFFYHFGRVLEDKKDSWAEFFGTFLTFGRGHTKFGYFCRLA